MMAEIIAFAVVVLTLLALPVFLVPRLLKKSLPAGESPGWLLCALFLLPAYVAECMIFLAASSPFLKGNEGAGFKLAGSEAFGALCFLLTIFCFLAWLPAAVTGVVGAVLLRRRRPPRSPKTPAVERLFEAAVHNEAKGEYDKAISLYREIIEKHPSSEWAKDSQTCMEVLQKRRA